MIVSAVFRLLLTLTTLVSVLLIPAHATAEGDYVWHFGDGVTTWQPDPYQSEFDDNLGRSPANATADPSHQYSFRAVLRDHLGNPVPGFPRSQVDILILSQCQNPVELHPDHDSNALGEMFWEPETLNQGGGSCSAPGVVELRVQSTTFDVLDAVTSPDQNGDGLVALSDLQIWQMAFVGQSPPYQGDLDFDGQISLSDLSRWQNHFVAP